MHLYIKIREAYQDCFHFSIHWDPSNYDIETLVSIAFSYQAGMQGLAGYLPNQNIKPVLKREVDPDILALSSISKLTRIQGFNERRALSHSLKAINMPLQKFFSLQVCCGMCCRVMNQEFLKMDSFSLSTTGLQKKDPRSPKTFVFITHPF